MDVPGTQTKAPREGGSSFTRAREGAGKFTQLGDSVSQRERSSIALGKYYGRAGLLTSQDAFKAPPQVQSGHVREDAPERCVDQNASALEVTAGKDLQKEPRFGLGGPPP